jgi:aminopeptidase N
MEEASGRDLAWFFRQWLNRAGSPELTGAWRYDATSRQVEIDLTQSQKGEPYRLPLEIGLVTEGDASVRVERVELDRAEQHFSIRSDAEPAAVLLDPNCWALVRSKFERAPAPAQE